MTEWDPSRRNRPLVGGTDRCVVYCSAVFKVTAHSDPNLVLQATKNNASVASGFCNNFPENTNREFLAQLTNSNFLSSIFLVQCLHWWTVTLLSLLCLIIMNNVLLTHRFSVRHSCHKHSEPQQIRIRVICLTQMYIYCSLTTYFSPSLNHH